VKYRLEVHGIKPFYLGKKGNSDPFAGGDTGRTRKSARAGFLLKNGPQKIKEKKLPTNQKAEL